MRCLQGRRGLRSQNGSSHSSPSDLGGLMRSIWVFVVLAACSNDVALGGPSALVRVDSEPPGANCPDGGVAIHTGLDQNGDGYLGDDEITSTQYVCNGSRPVQCGGGTVLGGTVAIASDADLAMLA